MVLLFSNCQQQDNNPTAQEETQSIFPKGELGSKENFTGKAWASSLVANDSTYNTLVGNVYFEPGARSNWHIHPAGQILIITDGEGYHQIKGQARQTLKKGDVVTCPPNMMHWHGASPEKGMQQMYIIPNTEKGIVKWLHPVTDDVYASEQ
ncbi:cupin domain-containing protein [Nibribacter ruber]|uniref:Cupin domain-containing protein n=1 Tax=Nibribacter ruber TaxID=2698458 RepID=A0A6P1NQK8_9BACT|nr:cupin domain-containing protein [Nibribacter ruber]QHL85927.1 cupin domain-containing protein [Nibribacter ruber]